MWSAHAGANDQWSPPSFKGVGSYVDPVEQVTRLAAYALCIRDGEVLLAQVSHRGDDAGKWTLPGGGLDFGEDPETGMHRELYEETGLRGEVEGLLGIDSMLFPDTPEFPGDVHSIRIVYRVTASGNPRVTEVDGTVQDARWVRLDELSGYPVVNLVEIGLEMAGIPWR